MPRQMSTGGKQILGKTSKLIICAVAVVRAAVRKAPPEGSWLARKPRLVVAIALANKMARSAWAMLTKRENYRDPLTAA